MKMRPDNCIHQIKRRIKGIKPNDTNSLSHSKWNCKYPIVFAPKYRRKEFYKEDLAADEGMIRDSAIKKRGCFSHGFGGKSGVTLTKTTKNKNKKPRSFCDNYAVFLWSG